MPKKAVKNAFYYYMLDFKEQQRKAGQDFKNLKEVAEAAGPAWREEPVSVQTKYKHIAEKEKQKNNITARKYTSTGIPLEFIEQQNKERQDAEQRERKDIINFVTVNAISGGAQTANIYVLDVNSICELTNGEHIIGEFTMLRFNLNDGIIDLYHELLNPGSIPLGYASKVKEGCQEFSLNMPDETERRTNYLQVLANIIDYLKPRDRDEQMLPPIFTMPEKVDAVQSFIGEMCRRAGEDETLFRIYNLHYLLFSLINQIKSQPDEGFPKESLALTYLRNDLFRYTLNIGCEHHNSLDKTPDCTSSRVKRWAYMVMDSCCPVLGVDMKPGKHLPADYDIESILTYKEEKKRKAKSTVAASCNIQDMDSSVSMSTNTSVASNRSYGAACNVLPKQQRQYNPLRKPGSKEYFTAPELSESEFPSLSQSFGRGRGSGSRNNLSNNFGKLNINN
ncbi:protein maelstrom homolog [Leptidea sinapis]|uniref:Maelstrom domain-containing protein n=1 Tax=Leptidea sinapis TaxID=189913 RepID=A0A5E4R0D2_9NEOP|nr:protein maelstrom homolog [Leptidea sinapis]VVD03398.1 unnamed protein product [Leptidea sinapis]